MTRKKPRILLIYNPQGIVDKDIYLSAQNKRFQVKSCEIEVTKTPEGHTVEKLDLLDVAKSIISFKPDFVLTVNAAGLDNNRVFSHFCAYMHLPLVIWYVDEPFVLPEWGNRFIPQTTVGFTFDRFYEKRLKEWGIPWVHTLPLGTNSERMLGYTMSKREQTPYANPISFVGTLDYNKIKYLLRNILSLWKSMPPSMVDVLDKSIGLYRLNPGIETEDIVKRCAEELGVEFVFPDGIVKQMILSFIDREASFRLRQEIVEGLRSYGVSVYGEPFWKKVVGRKFYGGPIDYYSAEIAKLYKASQINLNISKYQLKTTVNQRVFDCPLCDGFIITDYKEDIEEYFEIDKSIVVFCDLDDLKNKVGLYLENEKKAREIVENGKATILNRHTYQHRLVEMCKIVCLIKKGSQFQGLCQETQTGRQPPEFDIFLNTLKGIGIS